MAEEKRKKCNMNFKKIFLILDTIDKWNHLSTLLPDKVVIYNLFENKSKNNILCHPLKNIGDEYDLVKLLVQRGYINGKEVMDDSKDVTLGTVIQGIPCNKIEIINLTEKGLKLKNNRSKLRWYADNIQSFLKEYDEINKIILQLLTLIIMSIVSFCSGAVMALVLTHIFN